MSQVDFSKKCRDRVNFNYSKLRRVLEDFGKYGECTEWTRLDILGRGIETIQILQNRVQTALNLPKRNRSMSNKEACSLYRDNLNTAFDVLQNEVQKCGIREVSKFRLFSRSGIIEAAIFVIEKLKEENGIERTSGPIHSIIHNRRRSFDLLEEEPPILDEPRKLRKMSYGSLSPTSQILPAFDVQKYLIRRQLALLQYQQTFSLFSNLSRQNNSTSWSPWQ